ncbi:MAG: Membrane-bound lysozyme-inhibitor of c-type lysozyme [Candidatus Tokpelaia hoelldobleri]|uniref:Membrane-bound lysozyme-inhibitor of c-type lysozyme n=1 Tax=Candidatus Tokpelaia hoelldobleri TaxID=1902579 RepID=A0A1U9JVC4_9HYPH|nr:MAG: Membrane-bound lysozyme-inhibitor of c-type lysozyme [Candidatus Tokpelaia hoelldoblerii]
MHRFYLFLMMIFALSPAQAQDGTGASPDTLVPTHYICERNVQVPVVYINTTGGNSYAILAVEGKQVAMHQMVSASGAHYIALDEQDSYRWYTKGDEAFLAWLAADHTAQEQTLLAHCKAVED